MLRSRPFRIGFEMWYTFCQSPSFGRYQDPADYVVVEAASSDDANRKAQEYGVYFDGVAIGRDCWCCEEDRWSRVAESEGTDQPTIEGGSIVEYKPRLMDLGRRKRALIVPLRGESKTVIVGPGGK